MGDTPLIGRAEELAEARAALAAGGCVVAGVAGVGKSRLAAELAASVEGPVERVLATASARTLPFGAFSHLLATANAPGGAEIPTFVASLRQRSGEGRVTVVVDDAHLLDDASAALVLALAQTGAADLLLTVRSHEPVPDAVVSLWKERRVERIDIQPLTRADTRSLVEAVLGSATHTAVVSRVFELTEGSPLYVTELLRDAVRSGALAPVDGRWRWTGAKPELTRLRDLIAGRLDGLSRAVSSALEVVAMSAPIELDLLRRVVEGAAVEDLERSGLVRVTDHRGPMEVELAHPLYGEVVAEAMPGSVAHEHRRALARAMRASEELTDDQVVRAASWTLASGDVDHDLFVRASHVALRATSGVPGMGWGQEDADLAIRLADAAGSTFAAAMASALGRLASNRGQEVEAILAPFEAEAAKAPIDVAIGYVRARAFGLYWGATDYDRARALLDRSRGWHGERGWAALLAMVDGWVSLELGRPAEGRAVLEPFVGGDGIDPTVHLELLVVYGLSITRLGLVDTCVALEPDIRRLADEVSGTGVGTPWAAHMVDAFVRIEALRDVDAVRERLDAAYREAQQEGNEAMAASIQMVLGRQALLRGHVADAVDRLREAVDGMVFGAERTALGLAHTYLARAHSLRGEADVAEAEVTHAARLLEERPNNRRLAVELRRARAWAAAARGRLAEGRRELLAVAEEAGEDVTGRSEALYAALRLGAEASECAEQLAGLVEHSENRLYEVCAAHARSLAARDPDAQLEAATQLGEMGADLFAAEAAAVASHQFARNGKRDGARRAAALSSAHASRCQGARTPFLTLRSEVAALTKREREVAELAARGSTNREIADRLGVSVRTVESFVLRACTKVGVTSRHELAPFVDAGAP